MTVSVADHQCAESDSGCDSSDCRQRGEGFRPRSANILRIRPKMICLPEAVPTGALDLLRKILCFIKGMGGPRPKAEFHGARP